MVPQHRRELRYAAGGVTYAETEARRDARSSPGELSHAPDCIRPARGRMQAPEPAYSESEKRRPAYRELGGSDMEWRRSSFPTTQQAAGAIVVVSLFSYVIIKLTKMAGRSSPMMQPTAGYVDRPSHPARSHACGDGCMAMPGLLQDDDITNFNFELNTSPCWTPPKMETRSSRSRRPPSTSSNRRHGRWMRGARRDAAMTPSATHFIKLI